MNNDEYNITFEVSNNEISNIINNVDKKIPKMDFIIPYRDRIEHKTFFEYYIKFILEDIPKEDYIIYFVHQKDTRPFNRGAMKNIGFLAIKYKYPDDYKNITFIFHDVDTIPYTKNLINYETEFGVVKHYYGFYFALGGIFSIKGRDFELTNGFPNFWAWGNEDNYMQHRVIEAGLKIDRSNFFTIRSRQILHFVDGIKRLICRKEAEITSDKKSNDGIKTIRNLNYDFNNEYIDVFHFDCLYDYALNNYETQDISQETVIRFKKSNNFSIPIQNNRQYIKPANQQQILQQQLYNNKNNQNQYIKKNYQLPNYQLPNYQKGFHQLRSFFS